MFLVALSKVPHSHDRLLPNTLAPPHLPDSIQAKRERSSLKFAERRIRSSSCASNRNTSPPIVESLAENSSGQVVVHRGKRGSCTKAAVLSRVHDYFSLTALRDPFMLHLVRHCFCVRPGTSAATSFPIPVLTTVGSYRILQLLVFVC
jgi:hypothetical protein